MLVASLTQGHSRRYHNVPVSNHNYSHVCRTEGEFTLQAVTKPTDTKYTLQLHEQISDCKACAPAPTNAQGQGYSFAKRSCECLPSIITCADMPPPRCGCLTSWLFSEMSDQEVSFACNTNSFTAALNTGQPLNLPTRLTAKKTLLIR